MSDLRKALEKLDREIEATDAFLRSHGVRKAAYLFDHALALYLQGAVEAADSIRLLARERHVRRAPMLARFLWETLVDVAYLTTRDPPNQEKAAARSLAWVLLEVERHYANARAAVGPGDRVPPPQPPETAKEGLDRVCLALDAHDIPCDAVSEAFRELRTKKNLPTHWSGHSARTRIEMAQKAGPPVHGWEHWAPYLYNLFSSGSHAHPTWWGYVSKRGRDRFVDPGRPVQLTTDLLETEEDTIGMVEVPLAVLPLLRALVSHGGC